MPTHETDLQALSDRLARRLAVARLAVATGIPTSVVAEAVLAPVVTTIDQVVSLSPGTALPPCSAQPISPSVEQGLTQMLTTRVPRVPDTVPTEWVREHTCRACGLLPDVLGRCRCS